MTKCVCLISILNHHNEHGSYIYDYDNQGSLGKTINNIKKFTLVTVAVAVAVTVAVAVAVPPKKLIA